jgi:hypothetical protein
MVAGGRQRLGGLPCGQSGSSSRRFAEGRTAAGESLRPKDGFCGLSVSSWGRSQRLPQRLDRTLSWASRNTKLLLVEVPRLRLTRELQRREPHPCWVSMSMR